MINKNPGTV